MGPPWALVFAGAMSGQSGQPPIPSLVDTALQRMVDDVRNGKLTGLIPFDRQGQAVQIG